MWVQKISKERRDDGDESLHYLCFNMVDNTFLKLMTINRFSNKRFMVPDTDGDHTIRMQLMALYLYNKCPLFNIIDTSFRILCHDLEECWMCDIPRPVKYHDEKILGELRRVQGELVDKDNVNQTIRHFMNSAKDDSVEGRVVAFLDIWDAYLSLKREAWMQHSDELLMDSEWSMKLIQKMKKELGEDEAFPKPLFQEILGVIDSDVPFSWS